MNGAKLEVLDYAVMAAYFVAIALVGYFTASRKNKDTKSFLLGGGKMPYFALGISCLMAAVSAFSLVMVPGEIYNHGLDMMVFSLIYPLLTIIAVAVFIPFYLKLGSFTPFQYLERRYSPGVRTLASSLMLYLRLIYLGMVLFSTSKIFEGAAGWPCWVTILLCGSVSIIFTSSGGLKSVVWIDLLQFIVLVGGLFCILGALFIKVDGGLFGGIAYAFQHGHGLNRFTEADFYKISPYVRLSFWLLLWGQLMVPINIMATDQMTVQRLLASGSCKAALKTQAVNSFLTIPTVIILWVIGLLSFAFFHQNPTEMAMVKSGDTALFTFISNHLPPPLPGLVIAGMLAAVISTLNAVFNSMATVYVKEIHIRCVNTQLDEPGQVKLSRIATISIGVFACLSGLLINFSAAWLEQSVVEAQTIFGAFDVIAVPAFLFAVLSRRASTLCIWVACGVMWGLNFVATFWYFVSTRALKVWEAAVKASPGTEVECGWGALGIDWRYAIPFAAVGLLVLIYWLICKRNDRGKLSLFIITLGSTLSGASIGVTIWALVSNHYCVNGPNALSFQWLGVPTNIAFIVLGIIWLNVGKVQPKEKYQGLTLFDNGEILEASK